MNQAQQHIPGLLFLTVLLSCFTLKAQTDSTLASDSTIRNIQAPALFPTSDATQGEGQQQDVSALLQSSRDVFGGVAAYNFSPARYRERGYGSELQTVMINGVPMHNMETGWTPWSLWSGLNDITRYPIARPGIAFAPSAFSGPGGFANISMDPQKLRPGTRFSYAITNRAYRHRVMFTHNTGVLKNGWAFSASGSLRWASEGYVEGTWYSGGAYFFAASKKLSQRHRLVVSIFGSPRLQARQGLATQEAYDLSGDPYYNPYWGYQDGVKRNSRVRNMHEPVLMIGDVFEINDKTSLESNMWVLTGRYGQTHLNWYDAPDPRPDYYRYLPSYYNQPGEEYLFNRLTNDWRNDVNTRQINWDQLYFTNSKNLYTVHNVEGDAGVSITGNRSSYIVEEYRSDPMQYGFSSVLRKKLSDRLKLNASIQLVDHTSHNFKVIDDLLGGDFWVDVDQFAERDYNDENAAQSDLNHPNAVKYKGDHFGYDYDIHVRNANAFTQASYELPHLQVYLGARIAGTDFWRTGNMINGVFPETSYGKSAINSWLSYGVKGGFVYKITGRHYLSANGQYETRPPVTRNAYLSPSTHDALVRGLKLERITAFDCSYNVRYPRFKARLSAFHTTREDQSWLRSFYHDELRTFINYAMTGVGHSYEGIEMGTEINITSTIAFNGAWTTGQYLYDSRPVATIVRDNSSEILAENRTVYVLNYHLGSSPEQAVSAGLKYNAPKYWWVGGNANYFDGMYIPVNPDRHTEEALAGYVDSDPQTNAILAQEKLDPAWLFNAFIGKSFRIKKYYLGIMLNVNNVIDNTSFINGGYEQLRYDAADIDKFPTRYAHAYGRSYFGMLVLRF